MKFRTLAVAAALAPGLAFAQTTPAQPETPVETTAVAKRTDAQLAAKLHHMNKLMIEAGELAKKSGRAAEMREYGKVLAADHAEANHLLEQLAKKGSLDVDTLAAIDRKAHQAEMQRLEGLRRLAGTDFDKAFATQMFDDHRAILDMLAEVEAGIQSADLKKYVGDLKSTLKHHEDLAAELKGEPPSGRAPPPMKRPGER